MSKCLSVIFVLLAMLLAGCGTPETSPLPSPQGEGKACLALADIDSLMWRQPDSAFALLQEFAASPEADSMDEFNTHYCQLLISELLYKNYYGQSNREGLLHAVDYLDSLTADVRGMSPQERNVFLDARAHYINGVGFYEQGDMVQACAEYLKTLGLMESRFGEKELTGKKARFMANTYNRLGDLFSEQFMIESSITCYEKALVYCKIEPTSPLGVSNILYRIGKQYDKKDEIDKARWYYEQALESMTATDNMVYRDIVASKALCDYQYGAGIDQLLDELRQTITLADNESERLFRFMAIGTLFHEEGIYDSSLCYLIPVFEKSVDRLSRMQAADYLREVYDSMGEFDKANLYTRFLVEQKKSEGDDKALVSKLEDMFEAYTNRKQEKQTAEEREKAIRKTINAVVPIAVTIALIIFVVLKQRSKKLLKEQQEETERMLEETEKEHEKELRLWRAEADKTLEETEKKYKEGLETERLSYQKEQEALLQNLQQREAQVSALEKALDQQRKEAAKHREAFLNEEICQSILDLLHGKHITSRDSSYQHGIGLEEEDFKQLKEAVERHYKGFDNMLLSQCASLKQSDLALCHLHLLGLNEGEIGALKGRTYSAIKKQDENLQEKLGADESLSSYVLRMTEGLCGTPNVDQKKQKNQTLQQSMGGNPNYRWEMEQESSLKSSLKSSRKIIELISASPNITISEIANRLGMTKRGIDRNIKILKEQGVIRRVGPNKGGHWEVIE